MILPKFLIILWIRGPCCGAQLTNFRETLFNSPDGNEETAIALLSNCLTLLGSGDILIRRNSNKYDTLNFQDNTRSYIRPLGILSVANNKDVAHSILCAKDLKLHIAIKSGGHSYEKYSFGTNSSIVIDLKKLNSISIDSTSATVGAGITFGRIQKIVWDFAKVGVVGGLCPNVGAGLMLGGGLGYFGRLHGMALDNVLEIEMVDANGKLLKANSQEYPDLYWALRGAGGGNFGVVTKIKYKTFNVGDASFKNIFITYGSSEFGLVFKAWLSWLNSNRADSRFTQFALSSQKLVLNFMKSGLKSSQIELLKNKFPPSFNTTILTQNYIQLETFPGDPLPLVVQLPKIGYFASKSYFSSKYKLTDKELQNLVGVIAEIPQRVVLLFSAYGAAINKIPIDATAFVHRTSVFKVEVGIIEKNIQVDNWVKKFNGVATSVIDNGESYQNNVDGTLNDYLKRYYGSNLPKLIQIKTKYDPGNLFNFPQSIPTIFNSF